MDNTETLEEQGHLQVLSQKMTIYLRNMMTHKHKSFGMKNN